jgi:hypothetical protein
MFTKKVYSKPQNSIFAPSTCYAQLRLNAFAIGPLKFGFCPKVYKHPVNFKNK